MRFLGVPGLQSILAGMLCLFGESRERGEDGRAVFLSFLFFFKLNVHMNSSFLGCKCPQRTRDSWGKTKSPERDTNKATPVRMPSAVSSFPRPRSASWRAPSPHPLGLPQDSGTRRTRSRGGELGPGAGEGRRAAAPRGKFTGAVGTSLPPARPGLSPAGPRRRGGGLPQQVPQGHARPGGCKPQAKVERGWSFPSNPFYTVKTAELSPRRPLLIGKQTDEKPKQTCELTFFPDVFPSQQKARSLEGNRSVLTFARFGAWAGALAHGAACVPLPTPFQGLLWASVSTRASRFSMGRAEATRSMQAPSCAFSRWGFLRRAVVGAWPLGAPSSWHWYQIQVPPKPRREEKEFGLPISELRER